MGRSFPCFYLTPWGFTAKPIRILSGTVNGVNTLFVFETAPSVISVDQGRLMQQISSDLTVNWTGATSVVLIVAPNFDLFAF